MNKEKVTEELDEIVYRNVADYAKKMSDYKFDQESDYEKGWIKIKITRNT